MAVKVFRLDVVPEVSSRLADELRQLAAVPVDHPAVVAVIDAGLEGTTAFLAMEYVAAETLDVSLRRLAPAAIETTVPLLRQVADALEAAWSTGIGHGALHPRDIFVPPGIGEGAQTHTGVRVAGFGVAQILEELRIPSPVRRPYTAPERESGGEWDIRADVYSLGVIAHELLTGRRPAELGESNGELPFDISPEQAVAIRRALADALAVEPGFRCPTPTAFVDALLTSALPDPETETRAGVLPVAPDTEVPLEPEAESEWRSEPEPAARWDSEPEPEVEPSGQPEMEPAAEPVWGRAVEHAGEPGVEASHPIPAATPIPAMKREPFQPYIDRRKETGMPRFLGFVAVVMALAVGTAFGYWLRGPAPTPASDVIPQAPGVTKVPAEEPIGTDVAVNPSSSARGSDGQPATPAAASTPTAPPASAPVSASQPAPATRGRLLVRSVPSGAIVSLDGRRRGTTPATIRDLPFGTYTLAISRSGYQRREQKVAVSTSVPAREVTVELTPLAPSKPAATTATTGTIHVVTRPAGATVSIDGRVVGKSPLRVPELSVGPHTVQVTLAGHKTVTTKVDVVAGQQAPVRVSLETARPPR